MPAGIPTPPLVSGMEDDTMPAEGENSGDTLGNRGHDSRVPDSDEEVRANEIFQCVVGTGKPKQRATPIVVAAMRAMLR